MTEKTITYVGGFWSTNIGNSFFDLPLLHILEKACPGYRVVFSDEQPGNRWKEIGLNPINSLGYLKHLDSEYIAISGCLLTRDFPRLWGATFKELFKRKVKLLLISAGGAVYDKKETEACRKFLARYPPYLLVSRDEHTYNHFSDLAEHSYNGIDCAFYLPDIFQPFKTNLGDYIVLNFDGSVSHPLMKKMSALAGIENEPEFKIGKSGRRHDFSFEFLGEEWNIDYNFRSLSPKKLLAKPPKHIGSFRVIRTKHRTDSMSRREAFSKRNMFLSDIPYTYLNIYANTKATFSNRVHACVATLAFGNPAMYFSRNPRSHLFERFSDLSEIKKRPVSIQKDILRKEKARQLAFLKGVLGK